MQQKLAENEKTGINVIKCSKISVKKFTELNFLKSSIGKSKYSEDQNNNFKENNIHANQKRAQVNSFKKIFVLVNN